MGVKQMDKNLARLELTKKIESFLEKDVDRNWYIGDKTVELMTEAALSVLFAVEEVQEYLKNEELS